MHPQEFQQRYLPYAERLYRLALLLLNNTQDAEDAVQETFLKIWSRAEKLEGMERPEAYFATTLRHICLNMLRDKRPAGELKEADNLPDESVSTDRSDHRDLLTLLLSQLSPKPRQLLTLRLYGNYSTREMAGIIGETEANTRSILSRARRYLREQYLKLT